MNTGNYIPSFHFNVIFFGLKEVADTDNKFQSVTGIKATLENKNIAQENFAAANILKTNFNPIILRRAIVDPNNSPLLQWVFYCLNNSVNQPLPYILIEILNDVHQPQIIFKLKNVSVVSWAASEINAEKSELLMEEITLSYTGIEFMPKVLSEKTN